MKKSKTAFFFVYGTLKKGGYFSKKFNNVRVRSEKAILTGFKLFNISWFPGIVKGSGAVRGELHEYKEPDKVLKQIDTIEGYVEENEKESLYLRRKIEVVTETGKIVEAYVYIFNSQLPKTAKEVKSGNWEI